MLLDKGNYDSINDEMVSVFRVGKLEMGMVGSDCKCESKEPNSNRGHSLSINTE